MSAKHTPGPWRIGASPGAAEIRGTVTGRADGVTSPRVCRVLYVDENSRANAALIAAAPDLLATIKEAVEQFGPFLDDGSIVISAEQVRAMRAAIAKAEAA